MALGLGRFNAGADRRSAPGIQVDGDPAAEVLVQPLEAEPPFRCRSAARCRSSVKDDAGASSTCSAYRRDASLSFSRW